MSSGNLVERFKYIKTLDEDLLEKKIVLLGSIDGENAILTLEKTFFNNITGDNNSNSNITSDIHNYLSEINTIANNDVYTWGTSLSKQDLKVNPGCKFNLIYPATEIHIRKYENSVLHMIKETPEAYNKIVKPYIKTMKGDRIQWVKNILFNGAESDRILFKNNDYIILPDMKWDGKNINSLYCCCIVYDELISSIRDLNKSKINYLEKIRDSILIELPKIYKKFNLKSSNLRLYVHYQPSYYHFHIHVVNVNFLGLANSMISGKAILLDDIIDNLRCMEDSRGYSQKVITYQLKETHKLWELGLKDYVQ
ncbi:hypothetical protein C6P40_002413 [Pichia californica]|uniref:M7GpppX diphosphatase n=1 Tax=Pichia californica TaxID=460514 RepID=A0A9P7BI87_9ASCO|nr:hypothetical protein C6P42_002858 [[Candida] californica]KAG0690543.1 hypothetical protein C6P40_002413 [[Candida] californica]